MAVTLTAYRLGRRGPEGVSKAAASVGFLVTAHQAGALETPHGQAIFVGLVLSWFGDVFLLSAARGWFLAGLVVFLLGHVAYVVAFAVRGVSLAALGVAAVAVFGAAAIVWRWLRGHVGRMKGPVIAYIVVISAMLAFASASFALKGGALAWLGAVCFYVSDLFVARQRFVTSSFHNRLIGLPIYYVGQLLLATYGGSP